MRLFFVEFPIVRAYTTGQEVDFMLKNIIVLFGIVALMACGGSSTPATDDSDDTTSDTTAPTVSTVTTDDSGADTELSSTAGDTRVSGAANATEFFIITFSEAMDSTTIIADNVTLTCNDAAVTIGTPATSDNIVWTIPVESDLTGYVACTLTLGIGLKDAAGNALAEAAAYAFNTQCSTDDDFSVDTLGFVADNSETEGNCWTYQYATQPVDIHINRSSYYTIADGLMTYISSEPIAFGGAQSHYIYKTFNAEDFTAVIKLLDISNYGNTDHCDILVEKDTDTRVQIFFYKFGDGDTRCTINVDGAQKETVCDPPTAENPLYLKLVYNNSVFTGYYRFGEDGDFSEIIVLEIGDVGFSMDGSAYRVGIVCNGETVGFSQEIGSFTTDATATGPGTQY